MAQGVTIYGWSAKRSGPGMSISGTDADGKPIKISSRLVEVKRNGNVIAHTTVGGATVHHNLLP